jgi:DNA-binding PadR family transcriptional regulator
MDNSTEESGQNDVLAFLADGPKTRAEFRASPKFYEARYRRNVCPVALLEMFVEAGLVQYTVPRHLAKAEGGYQKGIYTITEAGRANLVEMTTLEQEHAVPMSSVIPKTEENLDIPFTPDEFQKVATNPRNYDTEELVEPILEPVTSTSAEELVDEAKELAVIEDLDPKDAIREELSRARFELDKLNIDYKKLGIFDRSKKTELQKQIDIKTAQITALEAQLK